MRKILLGIFTLTMVLAMTLSPAGVAADSDTEPAVDAVSALRSVLAIKAPDTAHVGQKVTMKVVARHTGRPIAGAGVWAINVNDLKTESDDAELYAEHASKRGHFIGKTNRRGEVTHRFRETGRYILVTAKEGFRPGFAKIAIKPVARALDIRAPRVARVGQLITIQTVEKHVQIPVADATVYAVKVGDMTVSTEDTELYADEAKRRGFKIGITDNNGNVTHRFRGSGRYVLVAIKEGFIPAFDKIYIWGL